MSATSTLNTVLGYLPYVLAGVIGVEQSIGSTAPGTTKKAVVLSAITAAAKVGEQVPNTHVAEISSLIDSLVATLNASGVFTHAATPATPVPVAVTP
jgi:hypothetical protein